jgi:formiminotetrahydrofolate cyclodeaminase
MPSRLRSMRVDEFLAALASGNATPGGGAAAALAGALGAALVAMTCNLTTGRPKYAAVEAEVRLILAEAEAARARLEHAIDDDAAAYDAVMRAVKLPKDGPEQAATRSAALQQALSDATKPPLAVAADCALVLDLAQRAVELVNPNAISDVTVGAQLARAGLEAAIENVEINLAAISDGAFVAHTRATLREVVGERAERVAAIQRHARARRG